MSCRCRSFVCSVAMAAVSFVMGLQQGEAVVRGGLLKKPVVLQNLRADGSSLYLPLWKTSSMLATLFAGKSVGKRPFRSTGVFELLTEARDAKYAALLLEAADDDTAQPVGKIVLEEDPVQALGLDGPIVHSDGVPCPRGGGSRRRRKVVKRQVPSVASVHIVYDGVEWDVKMLMDTNKVPSIELTPTNLDILCGFVQADVAKAGGGDGPVKQRACRAPKGPRGQREYFINNRWVKKE